MMFCGLAYGGIPTISAAVTGEFFGRAWYGKNLSILNLSIFPGSFAAMAAGAIQTSSGSYSGAFILFLALEAGSVVLMLILGKVRKRAKNP
jgi:OFA family oxalate/formate antiporter-like MFS transporter